MTIGLRRTLTVLVAAAVTSALVGAPAATAHPEPPPPGAPWESSESRAAVHPTYLRRAAHGAPALERLGEDLGAVAAANEMSARALSRLLLTDRSVWVHPTGRLFYIDPAPTSAQPVAEDAAEAAPFPYADTFSLHSKPGSARTIYLDFDGHTVSGTAWNEYDPYKLAPQPHPAFSLDADAATFNTTERDLVQSVWQRVSEDYAPFDVDVTTADPGEEALRRSAPLDTVFGTRALITPSDAALTALCNGGCGGIAFLDTFDESGSDYYQPAWVFPQKLGNGSKAIAEAVSHEVGHNLALGHDGAPNQGYYAGHAAWGPIMGSSYSRPISQWSSGEYTGATNLQDDLRTITENGLPVAPDDHGDSTATATPLTTSRTATGLVATRGDRDYFAIPQACAGDVTVTASPAPTSPNLDIRLRLFDDTGAEVAASDPASGLSSSDVASGMGAGATVPVVSGATVYAEIDGVGAGSPATTGYSDYASLGRYTITSTGCAAPDPAVLAFETGAQSASEAAGTAPLTVTRSGTATSVVTVGYLIDGGTATSGADHTLTAGSLTFPAGVTQRTIPVPVTDDPIPEPDETLTVRLGPPSTGAALGAITTSTLTILDDDAPAVIGFHRATQGAGEDAGTVALAVTRTGNTAVRSTVHYERTGGTMTTTDLLLGTGTVTFDVGETEKTIELAVVDDSLAEPRETVRLALSRPSDGTVVASTSVATVSIDASDQQPDLLISTRQGGGYLGDGTYNLDAAGQTAALAAARRELRTFFVRVTNDGTTSSTVTVRGTKARRGSAVTYVNGGLDVTGALTSSGAVTQLGPGDVALFRVDIRIGRRAAAGSTKPATLTASWAGDGVRTDVVKAAVRVLGR